MVHPRIILFHPQLTWCFQEINIENMNVELVAQMFKNYQSNVLFHLEGQLPCFTDGGNVSCQPADAIS